MSRHLGRNSAFVVMLATFAAPTIADALQYPDFKCRAAINKKVVPLGNAAMKAINSCLTNEMSKSTGVDCNDLDDNPVANAKLPYYEAKLLSSVQQYCHEVPASDALAEYQPGPCPSPAVQAVVGDFQDVAHCQTDIVEGMVENVRRYILNPDTDAIADIHPDPYALIRCAKTIAYRATKLWQATAATRGKCQYYEDKELPPDGDVDACATSDNYLKIAANTLTFNSYVDSTCGPATGLTTNDLSLLHSCGSDVATIKSCVANAIIKNASGVNSTSFEFPGVCPTEVKLTMNSGTPSDGSTGRQSNTALDIGWTGLGHGLDFDDGFVVGLDLNCSDASCSSCAVSANCTERNCRCSNNPATQCGQFTGPFTQDVCGAGNVCRPVFGPPIPLNVGGNPICVTNTIVTDLVGTADYGTGSSTAQVNDVAKVFLGISQSKPCPTCTGASIGASGSCSGGANNGLACITDAIHPDFGRLSYQCQPALAQNITGAGLKLMLNFTSGSASLPAGDACDGMLGSSNCACGVCSLDNSVTCNGDTDCSNAGLGTCEKGVAGAARRPNDCANGPCDDLGNGLGECDQSPPDRALFCDAYTRKSGDGMITCSTTADCQAVASECPGGFCGNCTLEERKRCFLDPIEATGVAGSDGSELVSTFCAPPTTNSGINGATGLPGPGRVTLDWDFTVYCPDGTTPYELGGANCPP